MGCRFGAALHHAGHAVQLVDPWAAHVAAIQDQGGLLVEGECGRGTRRVAGQPPAESTGRPDLILVFGKAMQTASLIQSAQHLVTDQTVVLTLQNGLGNIEAWPRSCPSIASSPA
jgi:2-dehydropantoate 2-reductase